MSPPAPTDVTLPIAVLVVTLIVGEAMLVTTLVIATAIAIANKLQAILRSASWPRRGRARARQPTIHAPAYKLTYPFINKRPAAAGEPWRSIEHIGEPANTEAERVDNLIREQEAAFERVSKLTPRELTRELTREQEADDRRRRLAHMKPGPPLDVRTYVATDGARLELHINGARTPEEIAAFLRQREQCYNMKLHEPDVDHEDADDVR